MGVELAGCVLTSVRRREKASPEAERGPGKLCADVVVCVVVVRARTHMRTSLLLLLRVSCCQCWMLLVLDAAAGGRGLGRVGLAHWLRSPTD